MSLTFSNRRSIPGGSYDDDHAWLRDVDLTATDRAQLLSVVQLFGPDVTEEEMLDGSAAFFRDRAQSLAECPVEWWDIGEDAPRFQLWLCNADSGFLFAAGTTEQRAAVIQDGFDVDEELPSDLRDEIARAARAAVENAPDSLLAQIDFGDSRGNVVTVT